MASSSMATVSHKSTAYAHRSFWERVAQNNWSASFCSCTFIQGSPSHDITARVCQPPQYRIPYLRNSWDLVNPPHCVFVDSTYFLVLTGGCLYHPFHRALLTAQQPQRRLFFTGLQAIQPLGFYLARSKWFVMCVSV